MTYFTQFLIDGLAIGSLYVLVTIGFTLVFGVMGLLNVAHADLYMVAVFVFLGVAQDLHFGIVLGAIAGIAAAGLVGALLFWQVIRRIDRNRTLSMFVATLGVSYFLENLVAKFVQFRTEAVPPLFQSKFYDVSNLHFSTGQIVLVGSTLIIAVGLSQWLRRSNTGKLMRAVSENTHLAELVAIDTVRIMAIAVILASVIAGIGGLLVANTTLSVNPFVANDVSLKMFAVAVVAGVGSVDGALVVGLFLGMIESLTVGYFGSQWETVIGLGAMIIVLLVRPQGLFGKRLRVG